VTTHIPVPDGTTIPAYIARPSNQPANQPSNQPSNPAASPVGVIVAHELFGVNPELRAVADDLAAAGYLAAAPEFYHREAPPGAWFARDDDGRAEGFRLLGRLTRRQALDDIAGCAAWLRAQPGITRIAVIGFSAGGLLAYVAACSSPGIDVAAVLYGGWLTAPADAVPLSQPTAALDLTPGIRGRIAYFVGEDDFLIDAAQRTLISDALTDAGVRHEMVLYPDTGHAFFWPGTPEFRAKSRDDAWSRILALLADEPPAAH
jgi:carboxymethylenebutenolidase